MNFISWVIEYSASEKAFHINELSETLKRNMKLAMQGISKDYLLVGGFITHEEAEAFCKELKNLIVDGSVTEINTIDKNTGNKESTQGIIFNTLKSIEPEEPKEDYSFVNDVSKVGADELRVWWSSLDFDWKWTLLHNLKFKEVLEKDAQGYWFSKIVYDPIDKVIIDDSLIKNIQDLEVVTLRPRHMYITHLEPLRKLSKLRAINCHGADIVDLSPISEAFSLELFQITFTKVASIEPIKHLTNLNELYLSYYEGQDYEVLANFKSLRVFECSKSNFSDLSVLSKLYALEELNFTGSPVHNLTLLYGLPKLSKLDIRHTEVDKTDITNFKQVNPTCDVIWDTSYLKSKRKA